MDQLNELNSRYEVLSEERMALKKENEALREKMINKD